jgi:hypothetical protein
MRIERNTVSSLLVLAIPVISIIIGLISWPTMIKFEACKKHIISLSTEGAQE